MRGPEFEFRPHGFHGRGLCREAEAAGLRGKYQIGAVLVAGRRSWLAPATGPRTSTHRPCRDAGDQRGLQNCPQSASARQTSTSRWSLAQCAPAQFHSPVSASSISAADEKVARWSAACGSSPNRTCQRRKSIQEFAKSKPRSPQAILPRQTARLTGGHSQLKATERSRASSCRRTPCAPRPSAGAPS